MNGMRKKGSLWRPILLLAAVILILVLSYVFNLGAGLKNLQDWIASLGAWGPVIFILLYAAATVAALPGSALTVTAGVIFGSARGIIIVSIASTLGATLSFLVSRYIARQAVENWLHGKEKFRRLDRLTETHGAVIVAITRLVPLFPFNLLNYGFGLTRVSLRTYVFWSWLCMLPGGILYVVGADAVTKAVSEGRIPWVLVLVLAVVLVFLVVVARIARKRI